MNILLTGAFPNAKAAILELEKLGHVVVFMQDENDELPCAPEWVEGVIGNGIFLSHPIEKFLMLRYIQLTSAGFDRVPMAYVASHKIKINNARGVYSIPMAEFAVGAVLQLLKQSTHFIDNQQKHRWEKNRNLRELNGLSLCILGCGSVGTECAKRFQAFGCSIIGVDLHPHEDKNYLRIVGLEDLDEVLCEADVVILTLPLTEQTRGLVSAERIKRLKRDAMIVNIARGGIVDQRTLTEALKENRIGGAVLDVFEQEPLDAQDPLWELENVILTPHNSFVSDRNAQRIYDVTMQNLKEYLNL